MPYLNAWYNSARRAIVRTHPTIPDATQPKLRKIPKDWQQRQAKHDPPQLSADSQPQPKPYGPPPRLRPAPSEASSSSSPAPHELPLPRDTRRPRAIPPRFGLNALKQDLTRTRTLPRRHRESLNTEYKSVQPFDPPPYMSNQSGKGKAKQQGSAKLRGRPDETMEMRLSKSITYVLRHGAQQEGLVLRPDGYARVDELLKLPKFQSLDFETLWNIVEKDNKNRFKLLHAPDLGSEGAPTSAWLIRANQGHTMEFVKVEVTPILKVSDIPSGIAVHGTMLPAWESIKHQGLSKMKRNHIHFAQGLPQSGVISGMRNKSQVYIYIEIEKAIRAGIKFFLSSNGVVLSDGDVDGFIKPEFFERVVTAKGEALTDLVASDDLPGETSMPVESVPTVKGADETEVAELQTKTE